MDYVVVSTAVTDDITLADGTHVGKRLGGAGIYALSGIRLWTDRVVLVTGVGADFLPLYGEWFCENNCATEGLLVKDAHSATTRVQYRKDGERTETPALGMEHYEKLEAAPDEIERFITSARGVYVFKDLKDDYWSQVLQYKKTYGFRLLWEINAACAVPEKRNRVRALASKCDVFSLNRTEAFRLFETDTVQTAVARLQAWQIPLVYLRLGGSGAMLIHDGACERVPCMPGVRIVDATGAGNSSSAAVLYGFCEGLSPIRCGILGSVAGAYAIMQYGPPTLSDGTLQRAANDVAKMCI